MKLSFIAILVALSITIADCASAETSVAFFQGEAQFFNGDYIRIESVTSSGNAFEVGATITVRGTYSLNSADLADLCFYTTQSLKPNEKPAATPVQKSQRMQAKRGDSSFELSKVVVGDGGPHLTFYDSNTGSAFGGVYFGDKSNVWMKKGWSYDAPQPVQVRSTPANNNAVHGSGEVKVFDNGKSIVVAP